MNPESLLVRRNLGFCLRGNSFFLYFRIKSYNMVMITKEQIDIFVAQSHRYGDAKIGCFAVVVIFLSLASGRQDASFPGQVRGYRF